MLLWLPEAAEETMAGLRKAAKSFVVALLDECGEGLRGDRPVLA